MKSSNKSLIACALAMPTLLSVTPVSAQIIMQPSGDYRDKLTRCNYWWQCYKEKQIATIYIPQCEPQLPNLLPTDIDIKEGWCYGQNGSLAVKARVDNVGDADSTGFEYAADISVVRVDSGATVSTRVVSETVRSLANGANWDDVLGFFALPDRRFDYNITVIVTADATNAASGGVIRESNESDNGLAYTCRMYGSEQGVIDSIIPGC